MHQIRFAPGLRPMPLGELTTLPRPPSWMGRGKPPPHTSPQCLRRLDLGAFGACLLCPQLIFRSRAPVSMLLQTLPLLVTYCVSG